MYEQPTTSTTVEDAQPQAATEQAPSSTTTAAITQDSRKRMRPSSGGDEGGRGKRLFGSILGTLAKNKKDLGDKSEAEKRREELEKRLREKLEAEKAKLRAEVEEDNARKAKERNERLLRETTERREAAVRFVAAVFITHLPMGMHQKEAITANNRFTARFLKTKTNPPILWLPAGKLNDNVQAILDAQIALVATTAASEIAPNLSKEKAEEGPDVANASREDDDMLVEGQDEIMEELSDPATRDDANHVNSLTADSSESVEKTVS
ncbi:hypothetical protein BC830DRAFT_1122138 [Chytriomyces sp. MP71]|nr:hypothetical protein BC830DRAFT_1122138 [Chytriomyces sp. MP71]